MFFPLGLPYLYKPWVCLLLKLFSTTADLQAPTSTPASPYSESVFPL